MNETRRKELQNTMKHCESEMMKSDFDPFSDSGRFITFKWEEAKKELEANPIVHHDSWIDGRGTGELPGFRFDLD